MTRPRKQTVDYFPHSCEHGQTMFILEQKYGNDGYAFWFKLLELLGKTEGHFLDCNKITTLHYLSAKTLIDQEKCIEILSLLSELDAIDGDLWKNRIIWSDNFLKGLSFAYRNRDYPIPDKPVIQCNQSRISGVNDVDYPQSKVKERKGKETKDIALPKKDNGSALKFYASKFFEVDMEYRQKLKTEFPLLTDDLLLREFSNMEDWLQDNQKKKKFRSNGHLANQRLFIKNWLKRVIVQPTQNAGDMDAYLDYLGERDGVNQ